jgi:GTP pyrophosphokinase
MDDELLLHDTLLAASRGYLPPDSCTLVENAYTFARQAHGDQTRASGEPYITHPLAVANFLADMRMDAATLAASLLHDVAEDTNIGLADIVKAFGVEIARLVDGVTKFEQPDADAPPLGREALNTETLDKLLRATAEDIRVILIKLADRLHNMHTLAALPLHKRARIAGSTQEIYVPLAARLGIWRVKTELENLSLQAVEPELYAAVLANLERHAPARQQLIDNVTTLLINTLRTQGFDPEVGEIPSHPAGIYRTIQHDGSSLEDFQDPIAVYVLLPQVNDCYAAVGAVHALWTPVPGKFDDYIVAPKENLYRSLHTTVIGPAGRLLKVRLRTHDMHQWTEWGIFAHWRSRRNPSALRPEELVNWLRHIVDLRQEAGNAHTFVQLLAAEILPEHIHIYTPKGQMCELPIGATPIDFAYAIHTDIGHGCRGAWVNGQRRDLHYRLKNGDQVRISTAGPKQGPCYEWLNPYTNYLVTSTARNAILRWFRRQPRQDQIALGKQLLAREFDMLALQDTDLRKTAQLFGFAAGAGADTDDFLAAIGAGEVNVYEMAAQMLQRALQPQEPPRLPGPVGTNGIRGAWTLKTRLGRCCNPLPGQPIVGHLTRRGAVTVHRPDCTFILQAATQNRFVDLEWGTEVQQTYAVQIEIDAYDRDGLLQDFANIVGRENVNMNAVQAGADPATRQAFIHATLEIQSSRQLVYILHRINQLNNVSSVRRITN